MPTSVSESMLCNPSPPGRHFRLLWLILVLTMVISSQGASDARPVMTDEESLKMLREEALDERLVGHLDEALEIYKRAWGLAVREFGVDSTYVSGLSYEIGLLSRDAGKSRQAEEAFRQAIASNPNSLSSRVALADILQQRGDWAEAIMHLSWVLGRHRNAAEARKVLAMAWEESSSQDHPGDLARANLAFAQLNQVSMGKFAPLIKAPVNPEPQPSPAAPPLAMSSSNPVNPRSKEKQPKPEKEKENKAQPKRSKSQAGGQHRPKSNNKKDAGKDTSGRDHRWSAVSHDRHARSVLPGLVPPPPPVMSVFPGLVPPPAAVNPSVQLKTNVKVRKVKEPVEKTSDPSTAGADDDFLLDWADKGKKKR